MTADTVANILGALALAVVDEVDRAVADDPGLPPTEAAALVHLTKYRDEPIDGLRRPLGLSHPGCVRLVDRLAAQRLVTRTEGDDRRCRALRLTDAGEERAGAVLRRRMAALRRGLHALSAREQAQLGGLVAKVLTALIDDEADALAACRLCDYRACPDAVCPVGKALA